MVSKTIVRVRSKTAVQKNLCKTATLKNRQNKDLFNNGSLMKVESIAECEHSAILLTCIKP